MGSYLVVWIHSYFHTVVEGKHILREVSVSILDLCEALKVNGDHLRNAT